MAMLESEIYAMVGRKFNVGSPAQVGEILFDEMNLEGGKKGKNGKYATGADVLEDLATEHKLPACVLDWRQLSKLKSTYTDALQEQYQFEHRPRSHLIFYCRRLYWEVGFDGTKSTKTYQFELKKDDASEKPSLPKRAKP